jgi:hypothetical protein
MPVMVRRPKRKGKTSGPKKISKGIEAGSNGLEFITPDSINSTRMDHESLLGLMPNESNCILYRVVFKVNHLCQWTPQLLALDEEDLCFTIEGDTNMRDKIPLTEVRYAHRSDTSQAFDHL